MAAERLAAPPSRRDRALAWIAISLVLHAAGTAALLSLHKAPPPEPAVQEVALIWAEQSRGAADERDNAALPPPPRLPPAPEQPATPPVPPAPPPRAAAPPPPPTPAAPPPAAPAPSLPTPSQAAAALPPPPPMPAAPVGIPLPPPPAPPRAAPPAPPAPQPAEFSLPPPTPLALSAPPRPPPRPAQQARRATPPAEDAVATPTASGFGEVEGRFVAARPLSNITNRPPHYPFESRLRQEEGQVRLRLRIDPRGRVADLEVATTSGFPELDRAAMEAVRSWRFEPATRDGRPTTSSFILGVSFQIDRDR